MSEKNDFERETATCPVCSGDALKRRNGDGYICARCARNLSEDDVVERDD